MRYSSLILITFFLLLSSSCDSNECNPPDKPTFSLEDLNPDSGTHSQYIGPQLFYGKVTLYYFPFSETWGTCRNRFRSLDELYNSVYTNLQIIGVGKDDDTSIDEFINNISLPYVKDDAENKVWETWCPEDRDLFFLDRNGFFNTKINLTPGFQEHDTKEIIDTLLEM